RIASIHQHEFVASSKHADDKLKTLDLMPTIQRVTIAASRPRSRRPAPDQLPHWSASARAPHWHGVCLSIRSQGRLRPTSGLPAKLRTARALPPRAAQARETPPGAGQAGEAGYR